MLITFGVLNIVLGLVIGYLLNKLYLSQQESIFTCPNCEKSYKACHMALKVNNVLMHIPWLGKYLLTFFMAYVYGQILNRGKKYEHYRNSTASTTEADLSQLRNRVSRGAGSMREVQPEHKEVQQQLLPNVQSSREEVRGGEQTSTETETERPGQPS
jgi:hypothetical protein